MPKNRPYALPALLAALLLAAAPALAAGAERTVEKSFASPPVNLEIENLAGRMELVRSSGPALRVVATVRSEASAGKSADELGRMLEVRFDESSGILKVAAEFPTSEWTRYHYPNPKSGSSTGWDWFGGESRSTLEYRGRRVSVVGSSSSGTPTLWVDFRVEVPSGLRVKARNAVGFVTSNGLEGPQDLDTNSGDIEVRDGAGALDLDTGSGDIRVADHDGDVRGDTGSGDVHLERIQANQVVADTGSGDVDLVQVAGALDLDTGSGDVVGRELTVGQRLRANTGSGNVKLAGDFANVRDLNVDTGSGDVLLTVTGGSPSVRLTIDTGSGDVEIDLADARVKKWKGEVVAEIGGAEGRGVIDTGSGDVTLRRGR